MAKFNTVKFSFRRAVPFLIAILAVALMAGCAVGNGPESPADDPAPSASVLGGREVRLDFSDSNLFDVDYSAAAADSLDLASALGASLPYDLSRLTFEGMTVDGSAYAGAKIDGARLVIDSAAKAENRAVTGEKTATLRFSENGGSLSIDFRVTLCSAILRSSSDFSPAFLHRVLTRVPESEKPALPTDDVPSGLASAGLGDAYTGWLILGDDLLLSDFSESDGDVPGLLRRECFVGGGFDGRGHILQGAHTCTGTYTGTGDDLAFGGLFPVMFDCVFKNVILYEGLVTWVGGGYGSGSGLVTSYADNCTFSDVASFASFANTHGTMNHGSFSALVDGVGERGVTLDRCFALVPSFTAFNTGWAGYGGMLVGNSWGHPVRATDCIAINLKSGFTADSYVTSGFTGPSGVFGGNCVIPAIGDCTARNAWAAIGEDPTNHGNLWLADPNGGLDSVHTFHGWQAFFDWADERSAAELERCFPAGMWDLSRDYCGSPVPVPTRIAHEWSARWAPEYDAAFDAFDGIAADVPARSYVVGKSAGHGRAYGSARYYWMTEFDALGSGSVLLRTDEFPTAQNHSVGNNAVLTGPSGSFEVQCVSLLNPNKNSPTHRFTIR